MWIKETSRSKMEQARVLVWAEVEAVLVVVSFRGEF